MFICTLSLASALDVGGWSTPRPDLFNPGKKTGTCFIGGLVGPGTGGENLAATWIRSPDRPAHSESQYRLPYPRPHNMQYVYFM